MEKKQRKTGPSCGQSAVNIQGTYKEIAPKVEKEASSKAWNIESMEGHGSSGKSVSYLGSRIKRPTSEGDGWIVDDFYIDIDGDYWYDTRVLLPSGKIIPMEQYLFKKKVPSSRIVPIREISN